MQVISGHRVGKTWTENGVWTQMLGHSCWNLASIAALWAAVVCKRRWGCLRGWMPFFGEFLSCSQGTDWCCESRLLTKQGGSLCPPLLNTSAVYLLPFAQRYQAQLLDFPCSRTMSYINLFLKEKKNHSAQRFCYSYSKEEQGKRLPH